MEFETDASVALTFFDDALVAADEEVLDRLGELPHLTAAIRQAKIKKAHYLGADVEKALTNLGEVFYSPQDIYTKMRAGDFEMADFEAHGKTYKNSFVTYENFYQITRMLRFVRNPSVPSQRDFVSTKIQLRQPI